MANHIKKSAACHAKFQALITSLGQQDTSLSAITNLPMDTGGDESTKMELDIQPPTHTDTDQLDDGASDADDPPPSDDDDSDLQSDLSEESLGDQLSDLDTDSDADVPDSTPDHPFSLPPQAIPTQSAQFTMNFHPNAQGSCQRGTRKTKWETALENEGPNPHFPWRDLEEWELVEWLVDQRLSQRSINDCIKNKWVCTVVEPVLIKFSAKSH